MKIAITSPAGKVDSGKLAAGVSFLSSLGHEVLLGETLTAEEFWTAGSVELRAGELMKFWTDDSIDVVWAARGGFGCAHLLDSLDWAVLPGHEKILCGHSDISVLHLAFMAKGVKRGVSAAMPAVEFSDSEVDSLTTKSTFELVKDGSSVRCEEFQKCRVLKGGRLKGRLIPVTLSVLSSLCGSDFLPDFNGAVLVIEDINEHGYRLDGYLNQLRLSGILSKLSGLVFADFNNCASELELNYIYNKYTGLINGTVLSGLPFGHCKPRLSLPVGEDIDLEL